MSTPKIAAAVLVGIAVLLVSLPAESDQALQAALCPLGETAKFVGSKECKTCHFKQYTSWKKTGMAKAFDVLKPNKSVEAKKKFNLDPATDYRKNGECVACHTTGYGKPGGYPEIVEGKKWTRAEKKRARKFEGVGCESCHGPGSKVIPFKDKNPEYKKQQILDLGLRLPAKTDCERCHNPKSPTITKETKLDYESAIKDEKKIHKHEKLKYTH